MFKLDLIGSEVKTDVQQFEFEKLPKIYDEVNLYIPLSDDDEKLMMKKSKSVKVESG